MNVPTVVEMWPIDRLVFYARNPRKNDAAVDRMCGSIGEFGFKIPILARSGGEVVDGHLRLKAARKLGITAIPVILCDEWTEAQVKAFRLLVKRSATWAEWDEELLALELQELLAADYDLALTGFDPGEIDELLAGELKSGAAVRNRRIQRPVTPPASASAPNPDTSGPGLPQMYSPVVEAIIAKHKALIGRILGNGSLASFPMEQVLDQFVQSRVGRDAGCTTKMHPSEIVLLAAVEDLVKRAAKTAVSPKRVKVYARYLAYAQGWEEAQKIDADHTFRALRESVGTLHGLYGGYAEPKKAEIEYRRGRKALQFVHSSTSGAIIAGRRLLRVFTTHQCELPQHHRDRFPPEKIQTMLDTRKDLLRATEPAEDYLKANEKLCRSSFSATKQAYIWWHGHRTANPGKWHDMYAVARAWRLTGIKDVDLFRRYVLRICRECPSRLFCPPGFGEGVTAKPAIPPPPTP